jgi:hypothetical protein
MKTRNRSTVSVVAGLLAVLMSGAAVPALAQAPTPPPGTMPQHMEGMHDMMGGPHHVLAMAYHANLSTFAKALQEHVAHSKTVDLELARPVLAEMRRSFEQMQQHHQAQMAQMAMMGDSTKAPMRHMETHLTALAKHLTALDAEVNAGTPDYKKIQETTAEILKQCAGMSSMLEKAKPHTIHQ